MYEETYKLFSHRPDIKAKRNYITSTPNPKGKGNVDTTSIEFFLISVGIFCLTAILFLV